MQALIILMSFLDFLFYPTIFATLFAVAAEQIVMRIDEGRYQGLIMGTRRLRKFFYRQAVIVNVLWFLGYAILNITIGRQASQMPDMIWQINPTKNSFGFFTTLVKSLVVKDAPKANIINASANGAIVVTIPIDPSLKILFGDEFNIEL